MNAIITNELTNAARSKWSALATHEPEVSPTLPILVFLSEAIDAGMLFNAYWEPTVQPTRPPLPGFKGIATELVHENLGNEIAELHTAIAKVQSLYNKGVEEGAASPMVRAEFVMHEIKAGLEYAFDDGVDDKADAQLEKVSTLFATITNRDTMAGALESYAELAEEYRARLDGLAGFDPALLDEARTLAVVLRQQTGLALVSEQATAMTELVAERNRLVGLLTDRVNRVRRAARYLFRAHPDIARKFSSGYQRTRRTRQRKAAQAAVQAPGETGIELGT